MYRRGWLVLFVGEPGVGKHRYKEGNYPYNFLGKNMLFYPPRNKSPQTAFKFAAIFATLQK